MNKTQITENIQTIDNSANNLAEELSNININLIRCYTSNNLNELPAALEKLQEFLGRADWTKLDALKRTLQHLHAILGSRLRYVGDNKNYKFTYKQFVELEKMSLYASSDIELKQYFSVYTYAIESSLNLES